VLVPCVVEEPQNAFLFVLLPLCHQPPNKIGLEDKGIVMGYTEIPCPATATIFPIALCPNVPSPKSNSCPTGQVLGDVLIDNPLNLFHSDKDDCKKVFFTTL